MKTLFFNSEIIWTTHLGTTLELMEKHLEKNDEVVTFVCNSFLQHCDQNLSGDSNMCKKCINKRKRGFSLLSGRIKNLNIEFEKKDFGYINKEMTLDQLKQVYHKNFDVGMAVISSLVSRKRDAYLSVKENYSLFNYMINTASGLYDFFKRKIDEEKPDIVYVFNGRFEYDRALMRACEDLGTNYVIYDGAISLYKYVLIENTMLHSIKGLQNRINKSWDESSLPHEQKIKIGEKFYHQQRFGSKEVVHHFVKEQEQNLLPSNWNKEKTNITFFLSSEDEFVAIGDEWNMKVYKSQLDGLNKILNHFEIIGHDFVFYIRIHPNTLGTSPTFIESVNKLNRKWVHVIQPDSKISSYALLINSDKAIVFGSTMGIEASFWRVPSINLATALYMGLGVTHEPQSHQEAIEMISNINLQFLSSINISKYGFHYIEEGIPYKYYQPVRHGAGSFKGLDLHQYNLTRIERFRRNVKPYIPPQLIKAYRKLK